MKLPIFVFFTILFLSCSNKSKQYSLDDASIIIDIDLVKEEPLRLNQIKFIPLETTLECLIGNADKILIKNDKIYVADFDMTSILFVFDLTGKFLAKIAKKGQGPGEYLMFNDFDVQANGDIYMLDGSSNKVRVYDKSGEYLREIKMDFRAMNFCLYENKIYLSRISAPERNISVSLAVYDMADGTTDFILQNGGFSTSLKLPTFSYGFYSSPSNIYCSPQFSPIIYSIGKDGVRPDIGVKNLNIPTTQIVDGWVEGGDPFAPIRSGYFLENVNIYETDRHISFACFSGTLPKVFLYDKQSKHICYSHKYYEIIGNLYAFGSIGKDFFGVVNFLLSNESHKKILETHEELAKWQEDDNPVIVIFNHE